MFEDVFGLRETYDVFGLYEPDQEPGDVFGLYAPDKEDYDVLLDMDTVSRILVRMHIPTPNERVIYGNIKYKRSDAPTSPRDLKQHNMDTTVYVMNTGKQPHIVGEDYLSYSPRGAAKLFLSPACINRYWPVIFPEESGIQSAMDAQLFLATYVYLCALSIPYDILLPRASAKDLASIFHNRFKHGDSKRATALYMYNRALHLYPVLRTEYALLDTPCIDSLGSAQEISKFCA